MNNRSIPCIYCEMPHCIADKYSFIIDELLARGATSFFIACGIHPSSDPPNSRSFRVASLLYLYNQLCLANYFPDDNMVNLPVCTERMVNSKFPLTGRNPYVGKYRRRSCRGHRSTY